MQKVNGVEQAAPGATIAPVGQNSVDPIMLPPELIARLREPLPEEAVSPNPQRPGLSVIKVIYVVDRLNEAFGLNGWRIVSEVIESGRMVVVKGTLKIPHYNIQIEQYGGNDNPDRGDAYKGACTDALSKCSSYLGIGMDVYKGLHNNRLKNGLNAAPNGSQAGAVAETSRRRPASAARTVQKGAPTGLTTSNIDARFSSMQAVLGVGSYNEILGRHGYREITDIPSLEKAREVYRVLLEVFRERFGKAALALGMEEYLKILQELRLKANVRLNPEQAVRVFNHMQETLNARE
jgi:hypothetical protein